MDDRLARLDYTPHEVIGLLRRPGARAVKAFFDSEMTMTFWKLRYPVVGEKKFGPITIPVRSIAADPSFGFPRALFT